VRHFNLIRLKSKQTHLDSAKRSMFMHRSETAAEKLTPRELQVEDLLCRGYSQENIAAIFGRSIHTISVQALSLYRKRGVHSQVGLLLAYLERKGICVFPDEGSGSPGQRASLEVLQCE
jgi:DNA-binding CsgD family transcriptional regulator